MDLVFLCFGLLFGILLGALATRVQVQKDFLSEVKKDLKNSLKEVGENESVHFILSIERESYIPITEGEEIDPSERWKYGLDDNNG